MSQRNVEVLLGRILTDDEFRRSFFPVRAASFELALAQGLELTPVERSALSTLRLRRFDFIAQSLDPRISRSGVANEKFAGARTPAKDI
jgi:hypothetical protein